MTINLVADAAQTKARPRISDGLGVIGLVALTVLVIASIAAIAGSALAPHDPSAGNPSDAWLAPSTNHLLGQDAQGRDVLSRILAGARSSMLAPFLVVTLSMVIGVLLALVAAWSGGMVDKIIASCMNIIFAFPGVLLAALAAAVLNAGVWAAVVALSVAYTPYVARLLRSALLRERNQLYIAAAEVQGFSAFGIWWRHLIPNVLPVIVAQGTIVFGYAVVDIAILSYLGLGIQPPSPDWGVMISENQSGVLQGYQLPALAAGSCIVMVVVSMNVLSERVLGKKVSER